MLWCVCCYVCVLGVLVLFYGVYCFFVFLLVLGGFVLGDGDF